MYPYKGIYRDLESANILLNEIATSLPQSTMTPGVRRKSGLEDRVMNVHGKRYRIVLEEGYMPEIGPVWYIKHFKPY